MLRLGLITIALLLVGCGDDPAPTNANSSKTSIAKEKTPPSSIYGRWRFDLAKAGATGQIWEFRSNSIDEIGICRVGWSATTDRATSPLSLTSSSFRIEADVEDNPDRSCHASLISSEWNFSITGFELRITNILNPEETYVGTYLGPTSD